MTYLGEQLSNFLLATTDILIQNLGTIYNFGFARVQNLSNLPRNQSFSTVFDDNSNVRGYRCSTLQYGITEQTKMNTTAALRNVQHNIKLTNQEGQRATYHERDLYPSAL